MIVNNIRNKQKIIDELKVVLSQKKVDIGAVVALFCEYCLGDLSLSQGKLEFVKKGEFYGSYLYKSNIVKINISQNKNSLYKFLNTLAHEFRHQYQYERNKKRFKKPTFFKQSPFPLKDMNRFLYYLIPYDEIPGLFTLEYFSISERDARGYASRLVKKLINDLKDDNNNKYLCRIIDYLSKENKKNDKKEFSLLLSRKEYYYGAYSSAKHINFYLMKRLFQVVREKPKDYEEKILYNCYQEFGSLSVAVDAYLSLYSDKKIVKYIFEEAEKLGDKETIICCLNHKNTFLPKKQIFQELLFLNGQDRVLEKDIKEQLYAFKEDAVKEIFEEYNQIIDEVCASQTQKELTNKELTNREKV